MNLPSKYDPEMEERIAARLLDVLIRADPALLARARRIVEDAQIILAQPKE